MCPTLGEKKALGSFSFFWSTLFSLFSLFLFFFKQAEDRALIRINLCDILDYKTVESLSMPCHTEKNQGNFFLTAGSRAACMKLQNEKVTITQHA
jgi:hypothetical protein